MDETELLETVAAVLYDEDLKIAARVRQAQLLLEPYVDWDDEANPDPDDPDDPDYQDD